MVAVAPGARRPRLHPARVHVPCEGLIEITLRRKESSETRRAFTSAAAIVELFVTITVQRIVAPTGALVGEAVLVTLRSPSGGGGPGPGGIGGIGGSGPGSGAVDLRVFVNVQTTT